MTKEEKFEEFQGYLDALAPEVIQNIQVVTPESIGQNFMVRIDKVTPEVFTPRMPKTATQNEDASVPRICVSSNFLEAVMGYARMHKEFQAGMVGYNMSVFGFEFAIKPGNKLVQAADQTNEYWLVNYNKDTSQYTPIHVGKMMIVNYSEQLVVRLKRKVFLMELLIEVDGPMDIPLIPGQTFKNGYYRVIMEKDNNLDVRVDTIEKKDFEQMRGLFAATLNIANTTTSILEKW